MFKSNGYNEDVDWWSVGITFYECIYGIVCCNHDDVSQLCACVTYRTFLLKIETLGSLYKR